MAPGFQPGPTGSSIHTCVRVARRGFFHPSVASPFRRRHGREQLLRPADGFGQEPELFFRRARQFQRLSWGG
eukprot:3137699-Lingulodinium_polyedra.AAC.1